MHSETEQPSDAASGAVLASLPEGRRNALLASYSITEPTYIVPGGWPDADGKPVPVVDSTSTSPSTRSTKRQNQGPYTMPGGWPDTPLVDPPSPAAAPVAAMNVPPMQLAVVGPSTASHRDFSAWVKYAVDILLKVGDTAGSFVDGFYGAPRSHGQPPATSIVFNNHVPFASVARGGARQALHLVEAMWKVRDLVLTPSPVDNPEWQGPAGQSPVTRSYFRWRASFNGLATIFTGVGIYVGRYTNGVNAPAIARHGYEVLDGGIRTYRALGGARLQAPPACPLLRELLGHIGKLKAAQVVHQLGRTSAATIPSAQLLEHIPASLGFVTGTFNGLGHLVNLAGTGALRGVAMVTAKELHWRAYANRHGAQGFQCSGCNTAACLNFDAVGVLRDLAQWSIATRMATGSATSWNVQIDAIIDEPAGWMVFYDILLLI